MNTCLNLVTLNKWQAKQLAEHIYKNQYYLGEKVHHEVSEHDAEMDLIAHYLNVIAPEMRKEYCTKHCPYYKDCELAKRIIQKDIDTDSSV